MSPVTSFCHSQQWIPERTTPRYQTLLTDVDGTTPLLAAQLETLTLTLLDLSGTTDLPVNGVDGVDILNADRGTLDAEGLLTIQLTVDDTAILDVTHAYETRQLLVQWTFGPGGVLAGSHRVTLVIENLLGVA